MGHCFFHLPEISGVAAEVLRETFRAEGVIARIGGDEFAVILDGITEDGMKGMICRIEERLTRNNSETDHPPLANIHRVRQDRPEGTLELLWLWRIAECMHHNKQTRKRSKNSTHSMRVSMRSMQSWK